MTQAYLPVAWATLAAAAAIAGYSCTGGRDLFSGSTTTGAGATQSTKTGGGGATTTTTATGGTGAQGGTGGGAQGGSGGSGAAANCVHGFCELGMALPSSCANCAAQVCQNYPYCCDTDWDYQCMNATLAACGNDCGQGLATCSTQYGSVPGFGACDQSPTTCAFRFFNLLATCSDTCDKLGGECIESYQLDQAECAYGQHKLGCDHTGLQNAICVCSRGCGAAPACAPQKTCLHGNCI